MTQKPIKVFETKFIANHLKRFMLQKTDVYHIDDISSLDILDLKNYGPENNRGYRYVLVIIDTFSKICWTVPLKSKNAQTIKDSFESIIISSKRKQNILEGKRDRGFLNNIFQSFLNDNNIELFSRNSSNGAVFADGFNRIIRDLPKRPVFHRVDANWIDVLPTITKQYNNRVQISTKLTSIQGS